VCLIDIGPEINLNLQLCVDLNVREISLLLKRSAKQFSLGAYFASSFGQYSSNFHHPQ